MLKKIVVISSLLVSPMAFCQSVTNEEIDRYLESLPQAKDLVSEMQSEIKDSGKENSKKLSFASMEGKGLRTTIELTKNATIIEKLTSVVEDAGFTTIGDWALTGDRIMGVMSSVQWVTMAASIPTPGGEEPDVKPDTNIFEYINDESKPVDDREKYQRQLGEMCERLCFEQADFDVVSARYTEISSTLNSIK